MNRTILASLFLFAGNCIAGDLVLVLPNSTYRVPIEGNVTINPSSGDVLVDPRANSGVSGDGWCPTGGSVPNLPIFTQSLQASTNSLPFGGGPVSLSWLVQNASGCVASLSGVSGWNGNAVTSPRTVQLSTSGNYSFSVTCSNTSGSVSSGPVTVAVGNPPVTSCNNQQPPSNLTRETSMVNYVASQQNAGIGQGSSVNVMNYVPLLGTTWNQANQVARVFIDQDKYVAMEFTTGGAGPSGGVSWSQSGIAGGVATVSISNCPGDFNNVPDADKCSAQGLESALSWKVGTKPATNAGFYCYLQPNTKYYLNATFDGGGCSGAFCDWLVSLNNQ